MAEGLRQVAWHQVAWHQVAWHQVAWHQVAWHQVAWHQIADGLRRLWQCSMLDACKVAADGTAMAKSIVKPRTAVRPKTERPPLYKVILLNDDYTPREFVV